MARVLVIGDPHFQLDNIHNVEIAIGETVALAETLHPSFIVILGDILHTHGVVYTQAYKLAILWMEQLSAVAHTYLIIGNHDYIDQTQFLTDNHIFGALNHHDRITVVDQVIRDRWGDEQFVFVPYVDVGLFRKALDTQFENWIEDRADVTCIFAHQEFQGVKMGSIISEDGDPWTVLDPIVVTGHIHETQILEPGIYYPGSLMQHAHGDRSSKSIWLIDFGETIRDALSYTTYQLKHIKQRKTVKFSISDIDMFDRALCDVYHVRLVLSGTPEEKKAFIKSAEYRELSSQCKLKIISSAITDPLERIGRVHKSDYSFQCILDDLMAHKSEPVQALYKKLLHDGLFS